MIAGSDITVSSLIHVHLTGCIMCVCVCFFLHVTDCLDVQYCVGSSLRVRVYRGWIENGIYEPECRSCSSVG